MARQHWQVTIERESDGRRAIECYKRSYPIGHILKITSGRRGSVATPWKVIACEPWPEDGWIKQFELPAR